MGACIQQPRHASYTPTELEIIFIKLAESLKLQKERKQNQIMKQESGLANKLRATIRNKTEEYFQMQKIVGCCKQLQAVNIVLFYSTVLRNNIKKILESAHDLTRVNDLLMYIYGVAYANRFMRSKYLNETETVFASLYGKRYHELRDTAFQTIVEVDLKNCYASTVATLQEINVYANEMARRNDISIDFINKSGHKFEPNK